jgi:hypothetical protein
VTNNDGKEAAIFRRTVGGKTEDKPDPIADYGTLEDCTHYLSRCLIAENIKFKETKRAAELTLAMISDVDPHTHAMITNAVTKHSATKTLALQTTQDEGQKVVDSGIFKAGDMVGYFSTKKNHYKHTALFVGKQVGGDKDPGGISCHTVCRFEGLSKSWNKNDKDAWFLGGENWTYTLIHFAEDDAAISRGTLAWLPGWWKVGRNFYFVKKDGRAISALQTPARAGLMPVVQAWGYYFEVGTEIVFIWRKQNGDAQVERWKKPTDTTGPALTIDGIRSNAERIEVKAARQSR